MKKKKKTTNEKWMIVRIVCLFVLLALLLAVVLTAIFAKKREHPERSEEPSETETLSVAPEESSSEQETESDRETESEESSEEASADESETASEEPVETKEPVTVIPSQPSSQTPGILVDSGRFPNVSSLSNRSVPYGNDWDNKDATGMPNGVYWYESMYGKYDPVYRIKTTEKLLYLTMDEGYEAGYTPRILDILKEKNVKAVFFLTKQFVDSKPELVQRMINEGHILGNHTCLHPAGGYPKYVDEHGLDSFISDVSRLHSIVYEVFGYEMKLFRFPEGESSEMLMAQLDNFGYTSVFWSYAHRDYVLDDQPEVSVTLERCLSHMAPGAVYLLHAVSSSNTDALADFIDGARAAGYEFGVFPVNELSGR